MLICFDKILFVILFLGEKYLFKVMFDKLDIKSFNDVFFFERENEKNRVCVYFLRNLLDDLF